jgi:hypothetical protein
MAETINDGKWHWYSVMNDLSTQGGLDGVIIDPLSVNNHGCSGKTKKGTIFNITWLKNQFLLVTVLGEELELIEAFAKVVEYRPFCRYADENGFITFEWDKNDPNDRLVELQTEGKKELQDLTQALINKEEGKCQ